MNRDDTLFLIERKLVEIAALLESVETVPSVGNGVYDLTPGRKKMLGWLVDYAKYTVCFAGEWDGFSDSQSGPTDVESFCDEMRNHVRGKCDDEFCPFHELDGMRGD